MYILYSVRVDNQNHGLRTTIVSALLKNFASPCQSVGWYMHFIVKPPVCSVKHVTRACVLNMFLKIHCIV